MTRLLEDFAQVSCDWFWEMDADLRFTYFSSRWEQVFGFSPQREIGKSRLEIAVNSDNRALWQSHIDDLLARRPFRDLTYPYRHQNGSTVWLRVSGQPVFGPDREFKGYRGVGTNVTAEVESGQKLTKALAELKSANIQLEKQNLRFDAALNNMPHGLCMWDSDLRIIVCNERFLEIYGFSAEVIKPGISLRDVISHSFEIGNHPEYSSWEELYAIGLAELAAAKPFTIERPLKGERVITVIYRPMSDGSWVATYEEITERKKHLEQLKQREGQLQIQNAQISHMAHHDALTGLPNRVLFWQNLERDLRRAKNGARLAVICVDLDGFKSANDTWGHSAGDKLLSAVTQRLLRCVDPQDTVARLGGDEFAVIRANLTHRDEAAGLARVLIGSISEPYDVDGHEVIIGASLGLALMPDDGLQADELLKRADLALYQAKGDGRGVFRFFEPEMDRSQEARRALEQDLSRALAESQFELFYQPIVNIGTGRITSCEALVRWHHPKKGLIMPGEFIGVAEDTALIVPLGEWVLRQACREAAKWPGELGVAVNLSPVQFKRADLVRAVIQALAASGLPAARLELEVTESVLLSEHERASCTLHKLRGLGVSIAIDDFGTGYSSFNYLRRFPFSKIKIDRSFIADFSAQGGTSASIVRAIAGIGSSLGMVTTAEGVETAEQFQLIQKEGCTEAQGYLFGRPVPAGEIERLIANPELVLQRVA